MDEDTCMVRNALVTAHFFEHESCGKCTPCREGTWWKVKVLERIEHGEGRQEDMDLLLDICDGMDGRSFCPLGDASAWAIRSNVKLFREEFERHVALGRCPANDDEDMLVGAHMGRGPAMVGVGAGEAGVTPQPSSGISVDGPTPSGAPSFTPSGGENVTSRREPLAQPEPVKELEPAAQAQPEPVKPEPVREPEPVAQIETPAAEEAPAEPEYEPGSYSKPPVDAATASEGPHDPFSFHKLEPPTRSRGPESTAEPKATPEPEPTREPERSPEPQASVEPEESREPGALAASETEQVAEPEAHQAEQTKEAEPVATATESSAEADPHTATPEQPHEPEAAAPAAGPTRRLRSPQHRIDEETS
jgi:hypothetical protein